MMTEAQITNDDGDDLPVRRWAGMSVRFTPAQWRTVRTLARAENTSVQILLFDAVSDAVRRRGLQWPDTPAPRKRGPMKRGVGSYEQVTTLDG
jgi:hypothetical protein